MSERCSQHHNKTIFRSQEDAQRVVASSRVRYARGEVDKPLDHEYLCPVHRDHYHVSSTVASGCLLVLAAATVLLVLFSYPRVTSRGGSPFRSPRPTGARKGQLAGPRVPRCGSLRRRS
jgi:hypothetical protein